MIASMRTVSSAGVIFCFEMLNALIGSRLPCSRFANVARLTPNSAAIFWYEAFLVVRFFLRYSSIALLMFSFFVLVCFCFSAAWDNVEPVIVSEDRTGLEQKEVELSGTCKGQRLAGLLRTG